MSQTQCIVNKDYYGIYKNTQEYQIKLSEISEAKEEVKHYLKMIEAERENMAIGAEDLNDSVIHIIRDYFSKRGKAV